jgi:oxygen-independent coproporphyrinogen-3 oxidase
MGRYDDIIDSGIRVPVIVEQPCGLYVELEAFSSDYGAHDYRNWVEQSNGDPVPAPIVLYLRDGLADGFCEDEQSVDQLDQARAIEQELRAQGALFDADRPLEQLIVAGSIAADWSENQLYRLVSAIQASFLVNRDSLNSWCACVGGTIPTEERLRLLRVLGFNHLRFTLEESVQAVLPVESLATAIQNAKQLGFDRTILDVRQMPANDSLLSTLEFLAHKAKPDRIRMPHPGKEGSDAFDRTLLTMGFRNFGLDWYLREDDGWWQARQSGSLYWTLLGYSELRNPDVIGVGPGALSSVGDCYSLNEASASAYVAMVERGELPVVRGAELEAADLLRREIIAMILTASCISVSWLEEKWGIQFSHYFARENELLHRLERDKRVVRKNDCIDIDARGYRELVEICNIFNSQSDRRPHTAAHPPSSKSTPVSKKHLVS